MLVLIMMPFVLVLAMLLSFWRGGSAGVCSINMCLVVLRRRCCHPDPATLFLAVWLEPMSSQTSVLRLAFCATVQRHVPLRSCVCPCFGCLCRVLFAFPTTRLLLQKCNLILARNHACPVKKLPHRVPCVATPPPPNPTNHPFGIFPLLGQCWRTRLPRT